jgi:hypothetical protein
VNADGPVVEWVAVRLVGTGGVNTAAGGIHRAVGTYY